VDVSNEAEAQRRVAVIQDQAVVLARSGAKAATDHLDEQDFRFGRPRQNDAADIRVEPRRENAHVADDLRQPGLKPVDDFFLHTCQCMRPCTLPGRRHPETAAECASHERG